MKRYFKLPGLADRLPYPIFHSDYLIALMLFSLSLLNRLIMAYPPGDLHFAEHKGFSGTKRRRLTAYVSRQLKEGGKKDGS